VSVDGFILNTAGLTGRLHVITLAAQFDRASVC